MTTRKPRIWDDHRVAMLRTMWPQNEINTEDIALALGVSLTALRRYVKKNRSVLKLKRRDHGGARLPKPKIIVSLPEAFAGPSISTLPPSDIPWPTPQQCMGRRA